MLIDNILQKATKATKKPHWCIDHQKWETGSHDEKSMEKDWTNPFKKKPQDEGQTKVPPDVKVGLGERIGGPGDRIQVPHRPTEGDIMDRTILERRGPQKRGLISRLLGKKSIEKEGLKGWYEEGKGLPARPNKTSFTESEIAGIERNEHVTFPRHPEGHPQAGQWTGRNPKSNYQPQPKEAAILNSLLKLMKRDEGRIEEMHLEGTKVPHSDEAMGKYMQNHYAGGTDTPTNHFRAFNHLAQGKYTITPRNHEHEDIPRTPFHKIPKMTFSEFQDEFLTDDEEGPSSGKHGYSYEQSLPKRPPVKENLLKPEVQGPQREYPGSDNVHKYGVVSSQESYGRGGALRPQDAQTHSQVRSHESNMNHFYESQKTLAQSHGADAQSGTEKSLLKLMKGDTQRFNAMAKDKIKEIKDDENDALVTDGDSKISPTKDTLENTLKKLMKQVPEEGDAEIPSKRGALAMRKPDLLNPSMSNIAPFGGRAHSSQSPPTAEQEALLRAKAEETKNPGNSKRYVKQADEIKALREADINIRDMPKATEDIPYPDFAIPSRPKWNPNRLGGSSRHSRQYWQNSIENEQTGEPTKFTEKDYKAQHWSKYRPKTGEPIQEALLKIMKYGSLEKVMERPEDDDPYGHKEAHQNPASIAQRWEGGQAKARMEETGETGGTDRLGPIGRGALPGFEEEAAKQKQEELSGERVKKVSMPTGNQLNAIENSLLKIIKYGSDIKPSEVGMIRENALLDKATTAAPPAVATRSAEETEAAGGTGESWYGPGIGTATAAGTHAIDAGLGLLTEGKQKPGPGMEDIAEAAGRGAAGAFQQQQSQPSGTETPEVQIPSTFGNGTTTPPGGTEQPKIPEVTETPEINIPSTFGNGTQKKLPVTNSIKKAFRIRSK